MSEATGTPLVAVPLYELAWREFSHGGSGSTTHNVRVERDAALSLFAALTDAAGFIDVELKKSRSSSYRMSVSSQDDDA